MIVLQLGNRNWQTQYNVPVATKWIYNDPNYFATLLRPKVKKGQRPPKQQKYFNLVLITSPVDLTDEEWSRLHWKMDPYRVMYTPGVTESLSVAGQRFLDLNRASLVEDDPQTVINDIDRKYFAAEFGGFRMAPNQLIINPTFTLKNVTYPDPGHLTVHVNSDHWQQLGSYRQNWYVAPHHQLKVWLEYSQNVNVVIRLRVALDDGSGRHYVINLDGRHEPIIPTPVTDRGQFLAVAMEVRGVGELTIGYTHGRWTRYGVGHYIPGGQRLVDPSNNEEIAYYFNPGDGKPPLNVYFSGIDIVEQFEGKNMVRRTHAPSICFFDPRLSLGEFYVSQVLEHKVTQLIKQTLANLNFTNHDLVMMGISAGSYAAVKLGAPLQPRAIIVGKLLGNLGHIAARGRLHRPNDFQGSYDVVTRILNQEANLHNLHDLDESYWAILRESDLTHTKVFVTYMLNDNFDNLAFQQFSNMPAVKASEEFAYKGYPGRHNDNSYAISSWLKERIRQVMIDDFGRRG